MLTINPLSNFSARNVQPLQRAVAATQLSLGRLSSGSTVQTNAEDPSGAAVSMQISATSAAVTTRMATMSSALSYLHAQEDALMGIRALLDQVSELKGMLNDATRSESDKASYQAEFSQLKEVYNQLKSGSFNGLSLFATATNGEALQVSNANGTQSIQLPQPNLSDSGLADVFANVSYRYVAGTSTQNPNSYAYVTKPGTWSEAKSDAESKGGYLATVTSQTEWNQIQASLGANFNNEAWLGAKLTSNGWEWVSGEPFTFSAWSSAYPFVMIQINGQDIPGNTLAKFSSGYTASPNKWINAYNMVLGFLTLTTTVDGYILEKSGSTSTTPGHLEEIPAPTLSQISAGTVDSALSDLAQLEASNAAAQNHLQMAMETGQNNSIQLQSVLSMARDTDIPRELSALRHSQILSQASMAMFKESFSPEQIMLRLIL